MENFYQYAISIEETYQYAISRGPNVDYVERFHIGIRATSGDHMAYANLLRPEFPRAR